MAEKVKDYYSILEVDKKATDKEIKNSYRKLAGKYHPDVNQEEGAQELFQRIVEAYEVLSNPKSRKEYDDFVKTVSDGKNISFKELFEQFNRSKPGALTPVKGDDVVMKVEFTVSEVRQQAQKEITFDRYVNCKECEGHGHKRTIDNECPDCRGKGYTLHDSRTPFGAIKSEKTCATCKGSGLVKPTTCTSCKGKGKKEAPVKIRFEVPKDATDGFKLVMPGKGDEGLNGGMNGDLIVQLEHSVDDPFQLVNDYDLNVKVDVPFTTSLAGGNVKVTLPRGETIKVPIARGTQSGHHIVIPEEGLLNSSNGFYGTLTLVVNVLVPSLPDEKIKKLLNILK